METSDIIQIVISFGSLWMSWKALKIGAKNELIFKKLKLKFNPQL